MEAVSENIVLSDDSPSRARKALSIAGWLGFGTACLILFTLLKLPEVRLKNYIQGEISQVLAQKGFTFAAESASLSLGFGLSYVMKDVTLTGPPPAAPIKIDEISVSPSLTTLLTGKYGGSLELLQGPGSLVAHFTMNPAKEKSMISVSLRTKALDLGKTGVLLLAAGIQGSGLVSGNAYIDGDLNVPATWSGQTDIDLSKVVIDAQSFMGFNIPRISISEGKLETAINQGKAQLQDVKLGKPGSADDVIVSVSGSAQLGGSLEQSTVAVKSRLGFSAAFLKALPVDMLLGQFKQPDGSFVYDYTGPLTMQAPMGQLPNE